MSEDKTPPETAQNGVPKLKPRQLAALESLMNREAGDTLQMVADRAGVGLRTLQRYLQDATFNAEYHSRVYMVFNSHKGKLANSLVKAAEKESPNMASLQKLFWSLAGEVSERTGLEISGPNGKPLQVESVPISMSMLSVEGRRKILAVLEEERILQLTGKASTSSDRSKGNGKSLEPIASVDPFEPIDALESTSPLSSTSPLPMALAAATASSNDDTSDLEDEETL